MASISVCMIVKNEEDVLGRCLDCIKDVADEIVIVDTGSTDKTKEIASKFTPLIYDFTWCDDFAAARNYSFSKGTMEYCMWLDADDVIDEPNVKKLQELKNNLTDDIDMVFLKYDVAFDEQGKPTMSYYRERIVKTSRQYQWVGNVHEVIPQGGKVIYKEISVSHKKVRPNPPGRNLQIYKKMIDEGKELDPRQTYYYGRELLYNGFYKEAIERLTSFLEEEKGWIENNIGACKDLATCYYCMQQDDQALKSLFWSFKYDVPRAEICCDIGKHFFDRGKYVEAIYWYKVAADGKKNQENGGFCLPDCYNYIPYMQMCVCYDRIGNREMAVYYNEKAGEIKPDDRSYLFNKNYFSGNIV